jgi:hypothetical protein
MLGAFSEKLQKVLTALEKLVLGGDWQCDLQQREDPVQVEIVCDFQRRSTWVEDHLVRSADAARGRESAEGKMGSFVRYRNCKDVLSGLKRGLPRSFRSSPPKHCGLQQSRDDPSDGFQAEMLTPNKAERKNGGGFLLVNS